MSSDKVPVPVFYGRIANHRIDLGDRRQAFSDLIYNLEGQEIEITLQKRRQKRSLPQNAYFHGVVLPMIAQACGYDRSELQEVKDGLKAKFLRTARSGIGIEAYRQMSDEMVKILRRASRGESTAEDAVQELADTLMAVINEDDRNKLQLVRSTADLDTAEFTRFVEDCRRWAAETLHLNIPDPNEATL